MKSINNVDVSIIAVEQCIQFMHEYVPRRHDPKLLVGYGIDQWFCQVLLQISGKTGECTHAKAAVVDSIPFINPTNDSKRGPREIDQLYPFDMRVQDWEKLCERRGLMESYTVRTLKTVPLADAPP